jgi:hypothetical protein
MPATAAKNTNLTKALPESVRESEKVREVLAGEIISAGTYSFKDGTTGAFAVAKVGKEWLGGEQKEQFHYFVTRGEKILDAGNLSGLKRVSGIWELRVNVDNHEIKEKDVPKGIPRFSIELILDEPQKAKILIRADGQVFVEGPVDVRLAKRGNVIRLSNTYGIVENGVEGTVQTLEEFSHAQSGVKFSSASRDKEVDFSNTLVGMWTHTPELNATVGAEVDRALSRRKFELLNVLIETVSYDRTTRGAVQIHFNRALNANNSKAKPKILPGLDMPDVELDDESDDGVLTGVISELKKIGEKREIELQFHPVDVNEQDTLVLLQAWRKGQQDWYAHVRTTGEYLSKMKPTPQEALAQLALAHIKTQSELFQFRERTVVEQMHRFGLSREDKAINLLLIGAAHGRIINSLPGAKPIYVTREQGFRDVLPAKTFKALSRMRAANSLAQEHFERTGKLPDHLVRRMILEDRLACMVEYYLCKNAPSVSHSPFQPNTAFLLALQVCMSACLTPADTKKLLAETCNPANNRNQNLPLCRWVDKTFGVDLTNRKATILELATKLPTKAAAVLQTK